MTPELHFGYLPGAIGRMVQLHADYYARVAGFGLPFEAKVATEISEFMGRYDPARDLLALVLLEGRIEASVAIDGAHAQDEGAHLRWFIASDAVRGQGLGARLLHQATSFADAQGYPRTYLWTFDGLSAARHLYTKAGFQLTRESLGSQWGQAVNEQMFVRDHG